MNSSLIIYAALTIIITLITAAVPLIRHWKEEHLHTFVSFSAGVLIATAFVHLLPEAIGQSSPQTIGLCVMGSFLLLFLLEKFVMIHPCEEIHCHYHTLGVAAYVGMLIHTFFDGLSLGSTFSVPGLGKITFFAIMAHHVPATFALTSVLKKTKWSNKKIILFMFLFALTIPLGATASIVLLKIVESGMVGSALALSTGAFLYIATSDFLPEVHRVGDRRFKNLAGFMLGIILMTVLGLI